MIFFCLIQKMFGPFASFLNRHSLDYILFHTFPPWITAKPQPWHRLNLDLPKVWDYFKIIKLYYYKNLHWKNMPDMWHKWKPLHTFGVYKFIPLIQCEFNVKLMYLHWKHCKHITKTLETLYHNSKSDVDFSGQVTQNNTHTELQLWTW